VSSQATITNGPAGTTAGTEGQIFYNSHANGKALFYRDDTAWRPIGDILGVTAGNGLNGGGTGGTVTLNLDAAQTVITSILATDLIIGEDAETAIDFGTADEIDFKVNNANRLTLSATTLYPATDNQISLGTSTLEFKDAWFDGTVTSDAFAGPLTGAVTGNADTATALETSRTIGMTGDVAWTSASFDGTGNVTGTSTIGADAVHHGMLNDDIISGQANSIVAGSLAQGDIFLVHDTSASEVKKITYSNLEDDIFDNVSGDGTIAAGGALTVTGANSNFGVGGNLTVTGDLTVSGTTTTVNSTIVSIADNLLKLASNQGDTEDLVDFGFYGQYGSGGTNLYAGLYRDRSVTGDPFIFFDSSQVDPGTSTDIATGGTYDLAPVKAGEITAVDGFVGDVTGNADTVTTNANLTGEVTSVGNAATIAGNVVDEANLKVSNNPTNGYFLSAQSGNTGGLTWAAIPTLNQDTTGTASLVAVTDSNTNTAFPIVFHDESNALLDDTGTFEFNPYTGKAYIPQIETSSVIQLGHASDTTIARAAAGHVTVEGFNVALAKSVVLLHGADGVTGGSGSASVDSTNFVIIHGFPSDTFMVKAEVLLNSAPYETVFADVTRASNTSVTITFATAVANSAYVVLLTRVG
jgi:hypothetical protein